MNELAEKLEELDLAEYLDRFLDQGFDTWDTVLDITEPDLEWQCLTPSEKEPYEQQSFAEKETFTIEMAEYITTESYKTYSEYLLDFKAKQHHAQEFNQQPPNGTAKVPKLQNTPASADRPCTTLMGYSNTIIGANAQTLAWSSQARSEDIPIPELRRALAAAPLSARCYKNIASALQPTSIPTFVDNNIPAISGTFSTMLATNSHLVKHSGNACSRVKNERNMIDPGGKLYGITASHVVNRETDCSVIVHGTVLSKQTSDDNLRKRKRNRSSDHSPVPERRGFDRGGPQYNALKDKNWLCNVQQAHLHGLTDANVRQLSERSQSSFSIPTADVEEASDVLSGNGMPIGQRAHLRDIESCIAALRHAQTITIKCAEATCRERSGFDKPSLLRCLVSFSGDDGPGDSGFNGRV
ncbi:hypothetical protein V493_01524 [Pseudogymnoascus sp. VKM F-4281 (FW-2241)]|nr:hypothetical protein V493_01524 [Pseudogymnoascus sp. VKM F-4281 (FW-2241)]